MSTSDIEAFETHRPLMLSLAYRMLGSYTDAEDIVQKCYLRYQNISEEIVSHKAFFTTMVTRMCINHLELAQVQRETYIGPWLPEPILTEKDPQLIPEQRMELHESLSLAFMVLLEKLTPLERAVFLLRGVFEYEYDEIAAIMGKEPAACRQLFSRARKHITDERPRFQPDAEAHRQLLNTFIETVSRGDLDAILQMLTEDVVLSADSGGKLRQGVYRPLHGKETVSRFVLTTRKLATEPLDMHVADVNGEPAIVLSAGNETRFVVSLSIAEGQIYAIYIIGNPDKLKWVSLPIDEQADGDE